MSFISYAQNYEDVMLWRALKHIKNGFYIDVGANDPDIESVTKIFYEAGWHGINIEPVTQWFERIEKKRPRDINLQVAAGSQEGILEIYELPDTGLSTSDKAIADRHERERGYKKVIRTAQVKTLTSICEHYQTNAIHFLKIDVEGAEEDVLNGIDFMRIRPWIIVIESTLPNSQVENYEAWEHFLLAANYDYTYFDGLNRFYIAREHHGLSVHFRTPPNIFDGFIPRQALQSEMRAGLAEIKAAETQAQLAEIQAQLAETKTQISYSLNTENQLRTQIADLEQRIRESQIETKTIQSLLEKRIAELDRQLSESRRVYLAPLRATKKLIKRPVTIVMRTALSRPKIRDQIIAVLGQFPRLAHHLKLYARNAGLIQMAHGKPEQTICAQQLTENGRAVHAQLNLSLQNFRKRKSH